MAKLANEEFKRRWVEALRSGKYKQGKGALRQDIPQPDGTKETQYCCLGVACEVAIEMGLVEAWWSPYPTDGNPHHMAIRMHSGYDTHMPPRLLAEKLFNVEDGTYSLDIWHATYKPTNTTDMKSVEVEHLWLPYMNDEEYKTFAEIADAIEKGM